MVSPMDVKLCCEWPLWPGRLLCEVTSPLTDFPSGTSSGKQINKQTINFCSYGVICGTDTQGVEFFNMSCQDECIILLENYLNHKKFDFALLWGSIIYKKGLVIFNMSPTCLNTSTLLLDIFSLILFIYFLSYFVYFLFL